MAFSSGFFNSKNHDRQYYNMEVSRLFDGLIRDGVFASIGTCFLVTPNFEFTLSVGIGRAWFNHTWSYNDSIMPIELEQSEILMDRIDAIVLEVNEEEAVRANSIKVIKGTPGSNPVKPELVKTQYVHQYPLAYVRVPEASTSIRQADIENAVGTDTCPFVSGILEVISIDQLIPQWRDILNRFVEDNTSAFNNWWGELQTTADTNWNDFLKWEQDSKDQFINWFENLKYVLSGDVAAKLTVDVDILNNQMTEVNTKITEVLNNQMTEVNTKITEVEENSATKPVYLANDVTALKWQNNNAPFNAIVYDERFSTILDSNSTVFIGTPSHKNSGISKEQVEAFSNANITGKLYSLPPDGKLGILLQAWGEKPMITLPIGITIIN